MAVTQRVPMKHIIERNMNTMLKHATRRPSNVNTVVTHSVVPVRTKQVDPWPMCKWENEANVREHEYHVEGYSQGMKVNLLATMI